MYSCIDNYPSLLQRGTAGARASGGLSLFLQLRQVGPVTWVVTLPSGAGGVLPLLVIDVALEAPLQVQSGPRLWWL